MLFFIIFFPVETKGGPHIFKCDQLFRIIMVMYNPSKISTYPSHPVDRGLRYHFLGGGNEVGNVGCILEDHSQTRLLFDYGLSPTKPPKYPSAAPNVLDALITHAHIDHIGMVPWLNNSYNTRLHSTEFTSKISKLMWNDCYKISKIERYPLPWDKKDAEESEYMWNVHNYDETNEIGEWSWCFRRAGHIPGSAMIDIQTEDKKILVTGDFDTRNSRLVEGAKPQKTDILFMEGTYGGKNHPVRVDEENRFLRDIERTVGRGGTVLVPSFAMGRSQEILMILDNSDLDLEVHYDGMGKTITKTMLEHENELLDPQKLKNIFGRVRKVSSKSDRKKALKADVIVTTSGMLDGGPAIWYLNRLRQDRRNSVYLTGYQAEGTGGRMLLEKSSLPIYGNITQVDLETKRYDFSTHAGHNELVEFVKKTGAEDVILYHSDNKNAKPKLKHSLQDIGLNVHDSMNRISYNIEY